VFKVTKVHPFVIVTSTASSGILQEDIEEFLVNQINLPSGNIYFVENYTVEDQDQNLQTEVTTSRILLNLLLRLGKPVDMKSNKEQ